MTPPSHRIRHAAAADAGAVAALHAADIPHGFLVTLGPRFLRRLYGRAIASRGAFVFVADGDGVVDGFVAAVERTGAFYREFLVRDGLLAAASAAPAIVRAPRRVWETLRYGSADETDLPPAEILALAVARRARGCGLGASLVDAALDELRRRGIAAARVVTAVDNAPAIRVYESAGFRRGRRTEVHAGIQQDVLVWR